MPIEQRAAALADVVAQLTTVFSISLCSRARATERFTGQQRVADSAADCAGADRRQVLWLVMRALVLVAVGAGQLLAGVPRGGHRVRDYPADPAYSI
jgi:hypothetical protein